jgi:hypothetical protein
MVDDDPSLRPARSLVEEHLTLADSTWVAGIPRAQVGFARAAGERAQRRPNSVLTARGGLRIELPDDAVAIAYEAPARRDPLRWRQAVAFCVPDATARRAGRTVVTELGPDIDALRPADTGAVLMDLGLGVPTADVCVRTRDQDVLPAGFSSVLRLRPAHPASAPDGMPIPFDNDRHVAFQALLAEFGDPLLGVAQGDAVAAVRAMREPDGLPQSAAERCAVAVALRRLAVTGGTSGTLTAWRGRYGPTPEPADPDEP